MTKDIQYKLLKEDFNNEYKRLINLEGKASNLLAVVGIILTFQGGLPLLSQSVFFTKLSYEYIILYIFPLICYAISIVFFLKAFSTSDYKYVPDTERIELYEYQDTEDDLKELLKKDYVEKFKNNNKILENKGTNIDRGLIAFVIGIIITLIYLLVTIKMI